MTEETCDHSAILKECLVAHLNGEGPCAKCPSCGRWVDGKTRELMKEKQDERNK